MIVTSAGSVTGSLRLVLWLGGELVELRWLVGTYSGIGGGIGDGILTLKTFCWRMGAGNFKCLALLTDAGGADVSLPFFSPSRLRFWVDRGNKDVKQL